MDVNPDERLISAVREYPELYDSKNRNYYDMAHRERVWEKISESLQEESTVVKKRWNYLRDCYRKCLKRKKQGDCSRFHNKVWKWEREMSFLYEHFSFGRRPNPTTFGFKYVTDVSGNKQEQIKSVTKEEQTDDEDQASRSLPDTCEFSDFDGDRDPSNEAHEDLFETETLFVKEEPIMIEKRMAEPKETPAKKLKTIHTAASSSTSTPPVACSNECVDRQEVRSSDHISAFFDYLEETVRRLPPLLQIEAKSKFSQILSEIEMKNLTDQ